MAGQHGSFLLQSFLLVLIAPFSAPTCLVFRPQGTSGPGDRKER